MSVSSRARRAAGFSFVEVLFAIMILAIGLIMIAAMFPVAIRQAQDTSDETASAAVARNAFALIQENLTDEDLPPVGWIQAGIGQVRSTRDPQVAGVPPLQTEPRYEKQIQGSPRHEMQPPDWLWKKVCGDMIVADDPRFAWIAFYRRDYVSNTGDWAPHAQVVVIVLRARQGSVFRQADVRGSGTAALQPRPVTFNLTSDGEGPASDQVIEFTDGERDAAATGAFLVVAHDPSLIAPYLPRPGGYQNGWVYRLGNHLGGHKWELAVESPFQERSFGGTVRPGITAAGGFIVGRAPAAGGGYEGVCQDVAAYSLWIPVRLR